MDQVPDADDLRTWALALELLGTPADEIAARREAARETPDRITAELGPLLLRVPPGLFDLLALPALDTERAGTLWRDAGLVTLRQLERACRRDQVSGLRGFDPALQADLLRQIQQMRRSHGRWLRSAALRLAAEREAQIERTQGVLDLARAGELRRALETVTEIVWVIAARTPQTVIGRLASLEAAQVPPADPPDTVLFVAPDTPRQRLVVVPPRFFAARLFLESGNRPHVDAVLARLAQQEGASGLAPGEGFPRWLPQCEEEIYARAGLAFVPPELREGRGEIEAAAGGQLPALLSAGEIRGILHLHTTWSDGRGSLDQMVAKARALGWSYVGISDHSEAVFYANGLTPERTGRQAEEIRTLRGRFPAMRIFHGLECDILPDGRLDLKEPAGETIEYAILAVHSALQMTAAAMTARIVRAMEHPKAAILAHPSGRMLLEREGYDLDWERIFEAAVRHDVALEFSTRPERLDLDWRLIRSATARGIRICINPDAHSPGGLNNVADGVATARKGWLTADQVMNTRTAAGIEALLSG